MIEHRSILIYRIGALGDTLVSLPALWAIREHFAGAHVTMLCDYQIRQRYVLAADLLRGSGVVDDFMLYPVDNTPWGRRVKHLRMAKLLVQLWMRRFDTLVYLAPSQRWPYQIERDRRFFRMAGIKKIIAMEGFEDVFLKRPAVPLPSIPLEADLLLKRLHRSGVPIPLPGHGRVDLGLRDTDDQAVERWLANQHPSAAAHLWIAVGPGSKMPAKIWPSERYQEIVKRLIERFDVWPVIFGGPEDREVGRALVESWGRGYLAAGELGLRASAAALKRCSLYLGNDTGTMHMAASSSVPCVALFSSRSHPHQWNPYGEGHHAFRTQIECEGCLLVDCIERGKECLMRIECEPVYEACVEVLSRTQAAIRRDVNAEKAM